MILDTASERPHGLGRLRGEIFDRKDELNVWDFGGGRRGEDSAVHSAEGREGFLAIDVVD